MATAAEDAVVADADHPDASDSLPLDVLFEVLSNERRRLAIRYLLTVSERTTLSELAEHIAGLENDKQPAELTSMERKRVYVCLYQHHLPKLADVDAIEFDGQRKTVLAGENLALFAEFLERDRRSAATREERPRPVRLLLAGWDRLRRWVRSD